jgi:hypothetical protein
VIDHDVGVPYRGFDQRREAPGMRRGGLVYPHDRGAGASLGHTRLYPGYGIFVDRAVSSVESVNLRYDDDFHPRFDLGALVQHVGYRNSGPRGHADSRHHSISFRPSTL